MLTLRNPGIPVPRIGTTHTLIAAIQVFRPGDDAPENGETVGNLDLRTGPLRLDADLAVDNCTGNVSSAGGRITTRADAPEGISLEDPVRAEHRGQQPPGDRRWMAEARGAHAGQGRDRARGADADDPDRRALRLRSARRIPRALGRHHVREPVRVLGAASGRDARGGPARSPLHEDRHDDAADLALRVLDRPASAAVRPPLHVVAGWRVNRPTPGRETFRALWRSGSAPPVWREVLADCETPVSAFRKSRGDGDAFLLESVEGGEVWGRYSILATDVRASLVFRGGKGRRHAGGRRSAHARREGSTGRIARGAGADACAFDRGRRRRRRRRFAEARWDD